MYVTTVLKKNESINPKVGGGVGEFGERGNWEVGEGK